MAQCATIDIWAAADEIADELSHFRTGDITRKVGRGEYVEIPVTDGVLQVADEPVDGNAVVVVESLDRSDELSTKIYDYLAGRTPWRMALYNSDDRLVRSRGRAAA